MKTNKLTLTPAQAAHLYGLFDLSNPKNTPEESWEISQDQQTKAVTIHYNGQTSIVQTDGTYQYD